MAPITEKRKIDFAKKLKAAKHRQSKRKMRELIREEIESEEIETRKKKRKRREKKREHILKMGIRNEKIDLFPMLSARMG